MEPGFYVFLGLMAFGLMSLGVCCWKGLGYLGTVLKERMGKGAAPPLPKDNDLGM